MIPQEAIEAAANTISECSGMRFDGFWSRIEDLEPEDREYALTEARAALESAAPYLIREARAAELEAAADGWQEHILAMNWGTTYPIKWLRSRAAAIRAGEA